MDDFTISYIGTALWSSVDDTDEPLDTNYDRDDIAPQSLADMVEDCKRFQSTYAELLKEAYGDKSTYDESSAGHDFWLTKCGHGAGFWDRGLGEVGEALSEAARKEGSTDLYVGDDKKIHAA